jgi:stearoyl-CoA desaturase (Delta-9 desaturase)
VSATSASPGRIQAGVPGQGQGRSSGLVNRLDVLPFLLMHLACLAVLYTGVDAVSLLLCGGCYLVRMFGISAGYHRYFSHRSYKTSRAFQFLLACLGCSALQKGPLWWAGHHRHHHRHSDTPADPHSPHETGFWWSHVGWILARDHKDTNWQAVRDLSRYPELRWLDRHHWVPGVVLAVLCFLLGGWGGLVWGFVVSTILVYHATFSINSLTHLFGTRRYATPDDSRNNLLLALLAFGEGWHNNHHHYQSSANQGFFWWEVDLSYYALCLLRRLGLVWDLRKPGAKALAHRLARPPARARTPEELRTDGQERAEAPAGS